MTRGWYAYAHEPTWLYRLYAGDGELLYVGITRDVRDRIKVHAKEKSWGVRIDHYTIERFPDRESAQEAERVSIHDEDPTHNLVRSPPRSRDCHATTPVTVTALSRGRHATNTSPHLYYPVVTQFCGSWVAKENHSLAASSGAGWNE